MAGVGPAPLNNNVEALTQQYYSQCLQIHVESIELCLDEGLGLGPAFGNTYGTEFDLDDLLRMDTATMAKAVGDLTSAGVMKPNEARRKFGLKPVPGGDTPYLQQQNWSLAALDRRDTAEPEPEAEVDAEDEEPPEAANDDVAEQALAALAEIRKGLA